MTHCNKEERWCSLESKKEQSGIKPRAGLVASLQKSTRRGMFSGREFLLNLT